MGVLAPLWAPIGITLARERQGFLVTASLVVFIDTTLGGSFLIDIKKDENPGFQPGLLWHQPGRDGVLG